MNSLTTYLRELRDIRSSGANVPETSFYGALANLRIRLRFESGHILEINEAVIVVEDRLVPLDYRYPCQDEHNHLLFRYDSTPHFPDLYTR